MLHLIIRIFANEKKKRFICLTNKIITLMKSLGYIGAFLGGAIAGAAVGLLLAPESGKDTRSKISGTVEDFMKKHNLNLSRKEVCELVDNIEGLDA